MSQAQQGSSLGLAIGEAIQRYDGLGLAQSFDGDSDSLFDDDGLQSFRRKAHAWRLGHFTHPGKGTGPSGAHLMLPRREPYAIRGPWFGAGSTALGLCFLPLTTTDPGLCQEIGVGSPSSAPGIGIVRQWWQRSGVLSRVSVARHSGAWSLAVPLLPPSTIIVFQAGQPRKMFASFWSDLACSWRCSWPTPPRLFSQLLQRIRTIFAWVEVKSEVFATPMDARKSGNHALHPVATSITGVERPHPSL